ncbi:MAG: S1 RNA-binding domain-containing protein [Ruminococcus sp.]|nr:S1 RNA-binding domain-containing protein [Ruminococcus sp.]
MNYKPEGCLFRTAENQKYISSVDGLTEAMEKGIILEARAAVCDNSHNLIVDLPCADGIIQRENGAVGIAEGVTRDIAVISRVNKIVCFKVIGLSSAENGRIRAELSRTAAQKQCISEYCDKLAAGDVIDARITHLEQFGCFVDIGCGVPSLIPIDSISVSRIAHPDQRFRVGQFIRAAVRSRENSRICLTHKELLGTWEENAESFRAGETVSGIVRSVENYGIFVELAPNLAGLAELRSDVKAGQSVSVYIKAIIPNKMKVKLVIVDICDDCEISRDFRYFTDARHIDRWMYSPESSGKIIETVFEDKH